MLDSPAGGFARVFRFRATAGVALVLALGAATLARAADRLPGQGATSGGGDAFAGPMRLTSAAGQAGAGRASGGNFIEVAHWLRRPVSGNVGVADPPPAAGTLEFAVRPNPVASEAVFAIRLPASLAAGAAPEVRIHDVAGRLVRVLRVQATAGEQLVRWDRRDAGGAAVRPGVYLARMRTGDVTRTRRIVIAH
ncbi:MAG: T9SS type A sorting domain-containing protein [Candidatus Eisenbacteria bacterium]